MVKSRGIECKVKNVNRVKKKHGKNSKMFKRLMRKCGGKK